jgi:hypothetical protein
LPEFRGVWLQHPCDFLQLGFQDGLRVELQQAAAASEFEKRHALWHGAA